MSETNEASPANASERTLSDLLGCPFCGGKAAHVEEGSYYRFKVKCESCGCTAGGSAFKNDSYNASIWNRRT